MSTNPESQLDYTKVKEEKLKLLSETYRNGKSYSKI